MGTDTEHTHSYILGEGESGFYFYSCGKYNPPKIILAISKYYEQSLACLFHWLVLDRCFKTTIQIQNFEFKVMFALESKWV